MPLTYQHVLVRQCYTWKFKIKHVMAARREQQNGPVWKKKNNGENALGLLLSGTRENLYQFSMQPGIPRYLFSQILSIKRSCSSASDVTRTSQAAHTASQSLTATLLKLCFMELVTSFRWPCSWESVVSSM